MEMIENGWKKKLFLEQIWEPTMFSRCGFYYENTMTLLAVHVTSVYLFIHLFICLFDQEPVKLDKEDAYRRISKSWLGLIRSDQNIRGRLMVSIKQHARHRRMLMERIHRQIFVYYFCERWRPDNQTRFQVFIPWQF